MYKAFVKYLLLDEYILLKRFYTIAIMAYPVTAKRIEVQAPLIISKKWLLFWRSILEASNSIIHYYSVQRLPIGPVHLSRPPSKTPL